VLFDSAPDERQPQHEKDGDDRADDGEERDLPVAVCQIIGSNKRHDGERESQAEGPGSKDGIGRRGGRRGCSDGCGRAVIGADVSRAIASWPTVAPHFTQNLESAANSVVQVEQNMPRHSPWNGMLALKHRQGKKKFTVWSFYRLQGQLGRSALGRCCARRRG